MPVVVGLLCYCALAIVGAPRLLIAGTWQVRRPRLAMALWHGFFASGLCAAALSMVWAICAAVGANGSSSSRAREWLLPVVLMIAGWLSLAVFGALVALVLQRAETMVVVDRHAYGNVATLMELATYRTSEVGGTSVAFVSVDAPVAFAAPGMNTVVISSCVEDILSPLELRSVIEHERTHLLQHHGLIKRLARLNRACLPRILAAEKFERATATLVELIADDRAARICGPEAASSALDKLAGLRSNESMGLRAERIQSRPRTHGHQGGLAQQTPELRKSQACGRN